MTRISRFWRPKTHFFPMIDVKCYIDFFVEGRGPEGKTVDTWKSSRNFVLRAWMLTRVTRVQLKWTRNEQVQFCVDVFPLVVHFDRLNQNLDQTLANERKKKRYLQYSVLKRSVCQIARIANCVYFRGVTSYVTQWLNLNIVTVATQVKTRK